MGRERGTHGERGSGMQGFEGKPWRKEVA